MWRIGSEQLVGDAVDRVTHETHRSERCASGASARQDWRAMDVASALGTYLEIADSTVPGLIEGLYVVGSYALDDWQPGRSDIDIVAVLAEPATDEDFGALRTAHALLNEHQPLPYIDGPYLAWADLISRSGHRAAPAVDSRRRTSPRWRVLRDQSRHLVHAGHLRRHRARPCCREAQHLARGRGASAVRDRQPVDLLAPARRISRRGVRAAGQLRSTWRSFEWCALGALRLHYTAFTGDVTSKRGAGEYGIVVTPDYLHDTLRAALARSSRAAKAR